MKKRDSEAARRLIRKQKQKRRTKEGIIILLLMLLLLSAIVILLLQKPAPAKSATGESSAGKLSQSRTSGRGASSSGSSKDSVSSQSSSSSGESAGSGSSSDSQAGSESDVLAIDSRSDWNLVLVNLKNPKPEMNPTLTAVDNIEVDSRVAQSVADFLAAAQQVDSAVHLISGYRSVAYQTQLFNGYVQQTMSANPGWTEDQAKVEVMKTSQPPECSEHETGLAIDMSAVDELDAEDPSTANAIAQMAPNFGFILRFPSWGTASTGIDYEDWHFRYVGVANAKYITDHHLTLEEFLDLLKK